MKAAGAAVLLTKEAAVERLYGAIHAHVKTQTNVINPGHQ
jgi:hypothetical protein